MKIDNFLKDNKGTRFNAVPEEVTKINKELDEFFKINGVKNTAPHKIDKTGKSKYTFISFTFDSGDNVVVACYDFSKEIYFFSKGILNIWYLMYFK